MAPTNGGHGRGDLGCVGRQGGEDTEQCLGQAESGPDALKPRHQNPARRQTECRTEHEHKRQQRSDIVPAGAPRSQQGGIDGRVAVGICATGHLGLPEGHADQASRLSDSHRTPASGPSHVTGGGRRSPGSLARERLSAAIDARRRAAGWCCSSRRLVVRQSVDPVESVRSARSWSP